MKIGILGASGRMGKELINEVIRNHHVKLSTAIVSKESPLIGVDAGYLVTGKNIGIKYSNDYHELCRISDAIIDFSSPKASLQLLEINQQFRKIHIIGTTGFREYEQDMIKDAARYAPIVQAPNMSIGVNILLQIVNNLAGILTKEHYDTEIVEMHHRHKKDAPSGTALLLGKEIAKAMGKDLAEIAVMGRGGGGYEERKTGQIGFSSLRGGDVVGDHTVIFAGDGERIEVSHKASDRSIFAKGAIKAALWAKNMPPALYSMADVINC